MSIVWLASYPKSGNTWLRAVLTSYMQEGGGPASINGLVGLAGNGRALFDEHVGLSSSDLTFSEVQRLRPLMYERLAAELPPPAFVKVHDACIRTGAGPLFPRNATAAAIYLVRNPLDVAPSYAHHQQWPVDRIVEHMNRPGATVGLARRGLHGSLPEVRLSWSRHVVSWLEADLPTLVVRYEDMLGNPAAAFGGAIRHAGLELNEARLARAIDHARFDRLRAQEREEGFHERQPTAPSFFRAGAAGGWREALTPAQVRSLVDAHAPVMKRLGYLDEAELFLRSARAGASRRSAVR